MGELASGHCKGQNQSQLIIANASIHTLSAADRQAAVAGGIAKHIALIGGQNHGGTVVSAAKLAPEKSLQGSFPVALLCQVIPF